MVLSMASAHRYTGEQTSFFFFSGRVFKISTGYTVYSLCLELEHNELRISAVQMFTDSTKRVISQDFTLFTSHSATKTK